MYKFYLWVAIYAITNIPCSSPAQSPLMRYLPIANETDKIALSSMRSSVTGGNVGIGTASPAALLTIINSGTAPDLILHDVNITGANQIDIYNDMNNNFSIGVNNSGFATNPNSAFLWQWGNFALRFGTNSTERMRITGEGNVGVATANPGGPYYSQNAVFDVNGYSALGGLRINGLDTVNTIYQERPIRINTGGTGKHITVSPSGNFGIGTTNPNDKLDVVGDIDATGCIQTDDSGTIGGTCVSDHRLKSQITYLSNSLEKVVLLKPAYYIWNEEHYKITSQHMMSVGLIAQEVEEVFPQFVTTGEDGYKRVRYDIELQMHVIQAVKELKHHNDELGARVEELEHLVALMLSETPVVRK